MALPLYYCVVNAASVAAFFRTVFGQEGDCLGDGQKMKSNFTFIFITQDDPFYVRCFFDEFLKVYPNPKEIGAVVIQKPMGKKSTWTLVKQMVAFYGLTDFFKMGLRYLKRKGLSKISHVYPKSEWFDLKQLCRVKNIKVLYQMASISRSF